MIPRPTPARRRPPRQLLLTLLAGLLLLAHAGAARADTDQISIMQDDQNLIYASSARVAATLATMQRLGVQEVRVNLEWSNVAPDPDSRTVPAGFDATDPSDYGTDGANWAPYDRLADLAPLYGITVQYNLTGPCPLWATATGSPTTRAATHWKPDATDFYAFAYAAGLRYGGTDGPARVDHWSLWNEPNQPGWLAPQWLKVDGHAVAQSPALYRKLLNAAYYGLLFSGHTTRTDQILIGETAPEGEDTGGFYTPMTPLPFLRDLYCVNAAGRRLRGRAARQQDCPTSGSAAAFAHANAGLFQASGYAHHPYDLRKSPSANQADPNMVPLADIGRLERFLNATFATYGVHRKLPLYLTEYGYETNPPDPHQVVTPAEQAAYLNEADYLAWRNPRIRSVAQFLLYDSAPNADYSPSQYDYWDTFQTGLLYLNGTAKPSLAAYRLPIWMPRTHVRPGRSVLVWGQVRPADARASVAVAVQWSSGHGAWRTLVTARTGTDTGYFTVHVKLPGSGYVRSRWSGVSGAAGLDAVSGTYTSRRVPVIVRR